MNILQSFMTVNSELWSQMELFSIYILFIFEQHRFELYMFTYRQVFFPPVVSTVLCDAWLLGSLIVEPRRWAMGLEHPVMVVVHGGSWKLPLPEDIKG